MRNKPKEQYSVYKAMLLLDTPSNHTHGCWATMQEKSGDAPFTELACCHDKSTKETVYMEMHKHKPWQ